MHAGPSSREIQQGAGIVRLPIHAPRLHVKDAKLVDPYFIDTIFVAIEAVNDGYTAIF